MAPSRKSRRTRRMSRKSRRSSRRASRRQRGGADLVLNCKLDGNSVKVTPPDGVTIVDASKKNTLVVKLSAPLSDMKFAGTTANKPVDPRYLGVGTGITIQQGTASLVPTSFSAVKSLIGSQKRMNASTTVPANTPITINNLNTSNLGLTATDTAFTITLTTA